MRIAYISFEYPPDTAVGGIATYVYQVSKMMKSRGHDIEIFSASPDRTVSEIFEGVLVHRIQTVNRSTFPKEILSVFRKRHVEQNFQIIESPEFGGDGYEIKNVFPSLPMVVKLHTPSSFARQLDKFYINQVTSAYTKARYLVGGLIKGQLRKPYWYNKKWDKKEGDIEYLTTILADQIHTPSVSLGDIVSQRWGITRERILNVPYPFIPNEKFLAIPVESDSKMVTYIGRLETRKGIVELVKAIPAVLEAVEGAVFNFIGKTAYSIVPGLTMQEYIETKLEKYKDRLRFLNVSYEDIPQVLSQTDVCVFPSIWENFPNVCLEAMAAGRAIVASKQGGMRDMLEDAEAGLLVDPLKASEISDAIIHLLQNNELRFQLGKKARQKVLNAYNRECIGSLMEQHYLRLIK